jgi:hypothetical protein
MEKYTSITSNFNNAELIKLNNEDGTSSFIPTDPENSDYQAYLTWLAEEEKKETN